MRVLAPMFLVLAGLTASPVMADQIARLARWSVTVEGDGAMRECQVSARVRGTTAARTGGVLGLTLSFTQGAPVPTASVTTDGPRLPGNRLDVYIEGKRFPLTADGATAWLGTNHDAPFQKALREAEANGKRVLVVVDAVQGYVVPMRRLGDALDRAAAACGMGGS